MSKIYSLQSIDKLKAKLGFRELNKLNYSIQRHLLDEDQQQRLLEVYLLMRNRYLRKRITVFLIIFLIPYLLHFWKNHSFSNMLSDGILFIHLSILFALVIAFWLILLKSWMKTVNINSIDGTSSHKSRWKEFLNMKTTNVDRLILEYFNDSGKLAILKFMMEEQNKLIDPIEQIGQILKKETFNNSEGYKLFKEIFKTEKL